MLKRTLIILIGYIIPQVVLSQQLPVYSQYMINGFIYNSAMAGYDGLTSVNFTARQQWIGIDNAPRTISLSFQTRILKRSYIIKTTPLRNNKLIPARTGRVGFGFNISNDRNGNFDHTSITMTYAYHIHFSNAQLSFGLSGNVSQYKINLDNTNFRDPTDQSVQGINKPFIIADANIGVFYINHNLYGGFSVADISQSKLNFGNPAANAYQEIRNYFIIAGYKLNSIDYISYEPTILIKTTEQLLPQIDFSFKVNFSDRYWMGLSYRTANTMILFMGSRKDNIYVGYSFDYSFSSFQRSSNTYGSHELTFALKFGDTAKRYRWLIRY